MMVSQQRAWRRLAASCLFALTLLLAACGSATPTAVPPTATVAAQAIASPTVPPTATPTILPPTATAEPTRASAPSSAATPGSGTPTAPPPTATVPPPTATPVPPTPTATPVPRAGLPVKLKIPKIKVDANIEYVGLTADGAMDVPKNYDNTAWYQLGPRPGEQGNAAIAGHVDSKTGKAVFWDLKLLKPGDEVYVDGEDGVERKFVVKEIASYKRADAPLDRIFGANTTKALNIITCDSSSTFNRTTSEYASNIVVYTELVDGQ